MNGELDPSKFGKVTHPKSGDIYIGKKEYIEVDDFDHQIKKVEFVRGELSICISRDPYTREPFGDPIMMLGGNLCSEFYLEIPKKLILKKALRLRMIYQILKNLEGSQILNLVKHYIFAKYINVMFLADLFLSRVKYRKHLVVIQEQFTLLHLK
jgi:hypothetical protein